MTIEDFKNYVKTGQALDTEEIHRFMDEMSDEARRVTFRLNTAYHTPDEVRGLLSNYSAAECRSRSAFSRRSMPISAKISVWVRMCLSTPAAIFRITAG